jgi:hypothetical protein
MQSSRADFSGNLTNQELRGKAISLQMLVAAVWEAAGLVRLRYVKRSCEGSTSTIERAAYLVIPLADA